MGAGYRRTAGYQPARGAGINGAERCFSSHWCDLGALVFPNRTEELQPCDGERFRLCDWPLSFSEKGESVLGDALCLNWSRRSPAGHGRERYRSPLWSLVIGWGASGCPSGASTDLSSNTLQQNLHWGALSVTAYHGCDSVEQRRQLLASCFGDSVFLDTRKDLVVIPGPVYLVGSYRPFDHE